MQSARDAGGQKSAAIAGIQPATVSELARFSTTQEAERLARLEADQELILRISVEGFDGPTWDRLSSALIEYGWAVITAWVSGGVIHRKCLDKGIKLGVAPEWFSRLIREDVEELAQDIVATSIISFRDRVLREGKWNPGKGASLSTYFIGNCLLNFPNALRAWSRAWRRRTPESANVDTAASLSDPLAELCAAEADSEALNLLDAVTDPVNREIVRLVGEGYELAEIGVLLELSHKQVEARLHRARVKLKGALIDRGHQRSRRRAS